MKEIRKPNLNGPRFREKRISILTAKTLKKFKEKYPEYDSLSLRMFKDIIMTFNSLIVDGIIDNRNGVELPEGLGYIFMGTCPSPRKKNIDYKKSLNYGVETTHKNWDSDNKLLKIFYTNYNTKYPFKNKAVWGFKARKEFRKAASEAYKDNWTKYIEVPPHKKISAMFDRHRKKEYIKNLKPIIPQGYDEFKM
jgi:hypothetical protein